MEGNQVDGCEGAFVNAFDRCDGIVGQEEGLEGRQAMEA
jgi:hypothetical protein